MQVSTDVLAVLSAAQVDGSNVLLVGQLDRALYTKTNKVLEAAGGKWNKKAKAHVFDGDASERIEQVILTGSIDIPKDEFNFFPSPPAVVDRVIQLADIQDGMMVLEPSAGRGALAVAAQAAAANVAVDMYELMPENNDALHALNLPLSGIGQPQDFLTATPHRVYDRVVMNPPFLKQADIKHVVHAHQFLKPGGLLVAVMAAGVTFRTDARTQAFNELVQDRGGHIEPLPENSFKSSGTGVNTVIAVIPA